LITCKKCNFIINGNLRYSIEANICPSCGTALLSNKELKSLKDIELDILNNGFKFDSNTLKNISIYVLQKISNYTVENDLTYIEEEFENEEEFDESEFVKNAKDEIEKDLNLKNIDDDPDDDRVSRLRKMAKDNPILNKKGTPVRRISSD
jgi:Zn-finger nucleic acid-binding protein